MRTIMNISLPSQMASVVTDAVKTGNYGSKSEFIRDLLRQYLENRLYSQLTQSQNEIRQGKGKLLTSLKDLR
jgi:putative addiction module CopG family antidote